MTTTLQSSNAATPDTPERPVDSRPLDALLVSPWFLELIPRDFAREHLIVSQGEVDSAERLAIAVETDPCAVFNAGVRLGRPVISSEFEAEAIARVIDEAYEARGSLDQAEDHPSAPEIDESELDRLISEADRNLLNTSGKGPVVRLVDAVLFDALGRSASDVHVQPLPDRTLIRYRLDGVLHTMRELSPGVTNAVISRIKVMGRMDIAERRVPQDGRAGVTIADRAIDLRISTLPTSYGERAVLRLLDNTRQLCDLDQLGMLHDVQVQYLDRATRSSGIILVTGPTGSGKTTTLYATLRRIGSSQTNIMTIEDPIEYELASLMNSLDGERLAISQSQVNTKKGVTFASGLRHILRQDPDVVMVGEIRDLETARIAIQSSLTGHLVFSTLHTNDAASAVTRLLDLGIEPYLVSASLSAILAQRLVRTLHQDCDGRGCGQCLDSGYRGRTGVFELMVIDDPLRDVISTGASLSSIRAHASKIGMRTLADEGLRLVSAARTTREELRRVIEGVSA